MAWPLLGLLAPAGAQDAAGTGLVASLAAITGLSVVAVLTAAVLLACARGRRESEARGRELAEAELDALLDSLPGGAIVWRGSPPVEAVSPGLASVLGAPDATIQGFDDLADHLATADFAPLVEELDALRSHGTPFSGMVVDKADVRIAEVHGTPLAGVADGGVVLWFNDISARALEIKTQFEQLRQRADEIALWRTILDSVDAPIWQRDAEGVLIWRNRTYADWTESTPEDAVAADIELAPVYAPEGAAPLARQARASGEIQRGRRHAVIRGARRLLEDNPDPVAP